MPTRRSGDYPSMRLRGSQTRVEFARASIKASPQSSSAGEPCGGSDRWHNDSPQAGPASVTRSGPAIDHLQGSGNSLIVAAFLTGKVAIGCACRGMSESGHRSCKCGAVYDRSEHIEEAREISSFECAVCGKTIENWNSAWVPRYRFIACPARDVE
jgi:hypothetical protein